MRSNDKTIKNNSSFANHLTGYMKYCSLAHFFSKSFVRFKDFFIELDLLHNESEYMSVFSILDCLSIISFKIHVNYVYLH